MTTILPPIRAWSKDPENRCAPHEIAAHWKAHDVLTFLADAGMYNTSLNKGLDPLEKARVMQFKTEYFKQRFVVSRSLLKDLIGHLQGTGNRNPCVLSKKNKRILVHGAEDFFVSLSYSKNTLAITLARRKIGSDIETVQPGDLRKVRSSPLFDHTRPPRGKKEESLHSLHLWTVVEAYAKLRDLNPYPLLGRKSPLTDAGFVSYCIDRRLILSLAYDTGNLDHAIFWIDPGHWPVDLKTHDQLNSPLPR